jgi:hypothetical protein
MAKDRFKGKEVLKAALSEPITQAPDLLFKQMIKLRELIAGYKSKPNYNEETVKKFTEMYHAMSFAWSYMHDTKYIYERNLIQRQDMDLQARRITELSERLALYEGITKVKLDGEYEKIIKNVDNFLNSLKSPDQA